MKKPIFTTKHYKAIAETLRRVIGLDYVRIVDEIVYVFTNDNPKFDGERFYDDCGVEPKK